MANVVITVVGGLTADPEIKQGANGAFAKFSVGAKSTAKKPDGTYADMYFNCTLFGKQVEYVVPRLQKGTKVTVIGDFSTSEYQSKTGENKTSLNIVANTVIAQSNLKEASNVVSRDNTPDYSQAAADSSALPF